MRSHLCSLAVLGLGFAVALRADEPTPNSTLNPGGREPAAPATPPTAPTPNSTLNPGGKAPPSAAPKPTPPLPALTPLPALPASALTTGVAQLSLGGDWQLTGTDPQGNAKIHIPGRVPGMVHPDLLRAGLIKDPFYRDQAKECQWVETWSWTYARDFDLPAGFPRDWGRAPLRTDSTPTPRSRSTDRKWDGRTTCSSPSSSRSASIFSRDTTTSRWPSAPSPRRWKASRTRRSARSST